MADFCSESDAERIQGMWLISIHYGKHGHFAGYYLICKHMSTLTYKPLQKTLTLSDAISPVKVIMQSTFLFPGRRQVCKLSPPPPPQRTEGGQRLHLRRGCGAAETVGGGGPASQQSPSVC